MAIRGGKTINGRHFHDCYSSGLVRQTQRFFIDGKLVSKRAWFAARAEAIKAEAEAERRQSQAIKLGSFLDD